MSGTNRQQVSLIALCGAAFMLLLPVLVCAQTGAKRARAFGGNPRTARGARIRCRAREST